jgi:hypothetical protein
VKTRYIPKNLKVVLVIYPLSNNALNVSRPLYKYQILNLTTTYRSQHNTSPEKIPAARISVVGKVTVYTTPISTN